MINFINAGNGDAILIRSTNGNILIDGGVERNAITNNRLRDELLSIINEKKVIDLAIVTHSDDDHIGGILNIVGDSDIEENIKRYLFHSEEQISKLVNGKYQAKESYSLKTKKGVTVKSGYMQDKRLTEKLDKLAAKWDKKINLVGDIIEIGNSTLTILSPTLEKIELLQKYWEKEKKKQKKVSKKSTTTKGKYDYNTLFKDFKLEELGGDNGETNGASIAFIYEELLKDKVEGGKTKFRALLLADSHPSVIKKSLELHLKENEDKHYFDVVKLAHHGSKNNITKELLDIIQCENFVISANANKTHRHPNKETLALILDHYGENEVRFYFTDDNPKLREIFQNEKFTNYIFPEKGSNKISISYGN